ncbi:hypothetical protein ACFQ0D_17240, partial [Micromonospora zhanjiangensis]
MARRRRGLTRTARVFVAAHSTSEQVGLVRAAVERFTASTGLRFTDDPTSAGFRATYCAGAAVPRAVAGTLPAYFTVWLTCPGAFPALAEELGR